MEPLFIEGKSTDIDRQKIQELADTIVNEQLSK
jgi:hypothetical protein